MRWQEGEGPAARGLTWRNRLKRWLVDRLVRDSRMRRLVLNALFSRHAAPGALVRVPFPDHAVFVDPRDDRIAYTLITGRPWQRDHLDRALATLRSAGRLPPDRLFLDIGANIGVISIYALLSGAFDRAMAIEPDPANAAILARNLAENDLTGHVAIVEAAATNAPGRLALHRDAKNLGAHSLEAGFAMSPAGTITVAADRLDTLIARLGLAPEAVGLAKIDVEGHEFSVLEGAPGLLAAATPLMIEVVFDGPADRDRLLALLAGRYTHLLDLAAGHETAPVLLADFSPSQRQHELLVY
jgi:FkbM family methyltransferase